MALVSLINMVSLFVVKIIIVLLAHVFLCRVRDWEKAEERVNRYADANAAPFGCGRVERMDKLFRSIGVFVCS